MKSTLLNLKIDFVFKRKLEMSNKEIREAKDELYRLSRSSKERELSYLREKSLKDEISALANAEEKGMEKAKVDIAKNMLNNGMDINMISSITGLSLDDIDRIR